MSSWFRDIDRYIDNNLEDFIRHFFPDSKIEMVSGDYRLNPAPCCGHNDCFTFARNMNAANCFSCSTSGNRVSYLQKIIGDQVAIDELQKWSGITRTDSPELSPEEVIQLRKERQVAEICEFAIDFYNSQLFSNHEIAQAALGMQLLNSVADGGRAHSRESLLDYRVGLSLDNFDELLELLRGNGYTDDVIEEAQKLIWVPPYYFIYPYYKDGKLSRINAKSFMRVCLGNKMDDGRYSRDCAAQFIAGQQKMEIDEHMNETGHVLSGVAYSAGDKRNTFFYKKTKLNPKKLIIVEGENDAITLHEEMISRNPEYEKDYLILAIGGNPPKGVFRSRFIRSFDAIYAMFDNDQAGVGILEELNEGAADVPVFQIHYDSDIKDPDLYFKAYDEELRSSLEELISEAEPLETHQVVIFKKGGKLNTGKTWIGKNRAFEMVFDIDRYNRKSNQLEGSIAIYANGKIVAKNSGGLDKMRVSAIYNRGKLELSQYLDRYYNRVPWDSNKPARDFKELADIVHLTKSTEIVIKQLAWYLHNTGDNLYNEKYKYLQRVINDETVIAEVLKEVNGFTNSEFDATTIPVPITLSQFFHVHNNDAYFYFNRLIQDGSSVKMVPFLLTNKKEEIRLDLIKQKDPQCLLLIENKYILPYPVETAPMDPLEVSLQPGWVDKWKEGTIPPEDLDPANLIVEIEQYIDKFIYAQVEVKKVLALWIYATYYHMLFKSGFPYIMLNGLKGTGKSTYDTVIYLLSLNAKMGLDFSSSALYRTITFQGGTLILDEIEHLSDKRSADTSDYAKILKGGYSDTSYVYRTDMDNGKGSIDRFTVFGPKVISNINGIDDVIADRCIIIRMFRVPTEYLASLENPDIYKNELRGEIHSTTSRCVLSAMENFHKVYELFNSPSSAFNTGNARLNQIIKPLFTIAKLVGGDYEKHLIAYYEKEIERTKREVADGTLEGMVTTALKRVANELTGIEVDKWATNPANHLYKKRIEYHEITGKFEIDSMHFKELVEGLSAGVPVELPLLHATIKNVLGQKFDLDRSRIATTITLQEEALQKKMGDMRTVRGYKYWIDAKDWADPGYEEYKKVQQEDLF